MVLLRNACTVCDGFAQFLSMVVGVPWRHCHGPVCGTNFVRSGDWIFLWSEYSIMFTQYYSTFNLQYRVDYNKQFYICFGWEVQGGEPQARCSLLTQVSRAVSGKVFLWGSSTSPDMTLSAADCLGFRVQLKTLDTLLYTDCSTKMILTLSCQFNALGMLFNIISIIQLLCGLYRSAVANPRNSRWKSELAIYTVQNIIQFIKYTSSLLAFQVQCSLQGCMSTSYVFRAVYTVPRES